MPATACEADPRVLAGIFSDDRADLPAAGLPPSLLGDLMDQVRCDALAFAGYDSVQRTAWFGQGFPADAGWDDAGLEAAHWKHFWDCASCSYPDRSGDLRRITKISDFYSVRQWHGTGMYTDYYRPLGLEHDLSLSLPAPGHTAGPGRTVRLFLLRGPGSDFSERDRALLALLRPHLHQAYLDAERRRLGTPQLTPRHWDLLRLVAAGYTNTQIARRLAVSEGTVRKHLENIYGRLGVTSRTAAVIRAFPDIAVN
jgi:DNA-binding CsgD family transcriptional regulator